MSTKTIRPSAAMNLEMARFSLISKGKTCLVPGWWEDEKCTLFNTLAFVFAQNYLVKGASLALTPYRDDFQYTYPEKINDFDFTRGIDGQSLNCPFSAHIRKVVPRNLAPLVQKEYLEASTIIRAGISYGPKVRIWFVCLCIHSQIIRRSRERSGTRGSRLRMKSNNTRVIADCFMCATSLPSTTGSSDRLHFANNDYFPTTSINPTKHGEPCTLLLQNLQVLKEIVCYRPGSPSWWSPRLH